MLGDPFILLVDDSPDDAFFFRRALLKAGFAENSLKHLWDGRAAVELFQEALTSQNPLPDAVFLDLKMPVMNGFEVLQWIQEQPLLNSLRVIVLSGSSQHADQERARQLGASDYLVKPILSRDLANRLRNFAPVLENVH